MIFNINRLFECVVFNFIVGKAPSNLVAYMDKVVFNIRKHVLVYLEYITLYSFSKKHHKRDLLSISARSSTTDS